MQHTTLPDSDTADRAGDGGYLFGREFALLHSDRMRSHPVANLFNFEHCRYWPLLDQSQFPAGGAENAFDCWFMRHRISVSFMHYPL